MLERSKFGPGVYCVPDPVQRLNLDLASLSGGGMCPSQYDGETHDGREVYCRYRGGELTIHIADKPGASVFDDGARMVVEADIGPGLHGSLSITALCELAGITVRGEIPRPGKNDWPSLEDDLDLSGATTFYEARVKTTRRTQFHLVERILDLPEARGAFQPLFKDIGDRREFVGARLIDGVSDISESRITVVLGGTPALDRVASWRPGTPLEPLFPDSALLDIHLVGIESPMRGQRDYLAASVRDALSIDIQVAVESDEYALDLLQLHASFLTNAPGGKRLLDTLDALVEETYPPAAFTEFDLVTGKRTPTPTYVANADPVTVAWVEESENRWMYVGWPGRHGVGNPIGRRCSPVEDTKG